MSALESVPVIDIQDYHNPATKDRFIKELGDAMKYYGFVRVKGHQVDPFNYRTCLRCSNAFLCTTR